MIVLGLFTDFNTMFQSESSLLFKVKTEIQRLSSADPLFYCEPIAKTMPLKRFLSILRFLQLNDNSKMPKPKEPQFDRLYKVRPMINFLKEKYYEIFSPSRYLSVDESMVGFKGRSSLKQYLPNKPTKRGLKCGLWHVHQLGLFLALMFTKEKQVK